jgi:ureidoglycolate lyase
VVSATVKAEPLTPEAYAPFGTIVEPGRTHLYCNDGEYFVERLTLQPLDGPMKRMNRHFDCHQLFIPLGHEPMLIVVAPPYVAADQLKPEHVKAFTSDGTQAFTFHVGTWHIGPRSLKGKPLEIVNLQGERSNEEHTEFAEIAATEFQV